MDEKKKDEKKKRGSPQTMQDFLDARERAKRVITLTQFFGIGKKRGALPAKNSHLPPVQKINRRLQPAFEKAVGKPELPAVDCVKTAPPPELKGDQGSLPLADSDHSSDSVQVVSNRLPPPKKHIPMLNHQGFPIHLSRCARSCESR